ncbi:MAG TPA: S41 family peptidase [Tepidisphaeraceae bacterium]|nr:S41 family peptidase [Tepidisphaeraceae bacterium]
MNREKLAWTVSICLLAVLAFQIPGTLAQRDDDYAFVRTLVDIHRRVADNYVDVVDESKLRQGAIDGMLGELDPFSIYVPPARQEDFDRMLEGSFKGVGIQLDQKDNGQVEVVSPIDGSPAFKAGIQAGDIILKVNGESIENLRIPELIKRIGGPLGSQVSLTVHHATGEDATLTMTREEIKVPTVKGYERKQDTTWDYYVCDDPKIAYVRLTQFTPESYDDLRKVLEGLLADGMKGLIFDLRFNPGGRLDQAVQIINMLVPKGETIVVTRGRNRPEQRQESNGENTLPNFPMIVLVNEHSASASEIVSGSLMDNKRAVVVGERSYGKGSVQEVIPLDEKGGELKLTVAYYYLPSGRLVHRRKDAKDWGVQPQIPVPMDPATEEKVAKERYEAELFKRPLPKSVTRPATTQANATTQPLAPTLDDTQLQAAINTMLGVIVFESQPGGKLPATNPAVIATPATQPATQPGA